MTSVHDIQRQIVNYPSYDVYPPRKMENVIKMSPDSTISHLWDMDLSQPVSLLEYITAHNRTSKLNAGITQRTRRTQHDGLRRVHSSTSK